MGSESLFPPSPSLTSSHCLVSESHIDISGTIGKFSKPQSFPKCWLRKLDCLVCIYRTFPPGFPIHVGKQSMWKKWLYKALILASLWNHHLSYTQIKHTWDLQGIWGKKVGWGGRAGGGGVLEIKNINLFRSHWDIRASRAVLHDSAVRR